MPFGLSIALLISSCTLLAHEVPVGCTEGTPCVGLNTRFGIEDDCEMWFCRFTPGQQGTCEFGAIDRDGDGVAACLPTGGDCDDSPPQPDDPLVSTSSAVSPNVGERPCNGVDDDCDGLIDESPFVSATPASVADVDPIDRASLTVLDDGLAWGNTTRTRDGEGNDIELGALHRLSEEGPLARRAELAWYFADPELNAIATFAPGTPEPAPGSLPPWGMLAGVGGFADLALAPSAGNGLVLAGISADGLLCEEGRLRIAVIPDDPSTARAEVLGGPRRETPEDRDFPRSAISLLVDMEERMLDGETHFCTGPGGASRVALAMASELTPPVGMVLYAEETAKVRRSCGGVPVPLHALGIVEERGGSSQLHVWISGLQAPDGMEGAVSHIESIVIGEITGAAPPAVVAAESGEVFVAFPEGDEVVLLSFALPASPFPYSTSRDPDARYDVDTRMGMPVFSEPVELHRFPAPNADHVALAQYVATSGATILGLAWQEGCGAGDEAHEGSIRAATFTVNPRTASEVVLIADVGRTPTLSAARDLVRTGWPITTLGGASVPVADGFVLAYVDGAETLGARVAWLLEDGQVPSVRLPIAVDAAGTIADRVQSVLSATHERGEPMLVLATGASAGPLTLHRAALRCPPPL
jgi:hypothetical protein